MKKTNFIIIFVITIATFVSCNQNKISELNNKISELNKLNSVLQDSILKVQTTNLADFQLLGISEQSSLKVGEKGKVNFIFAPRKNIGTYNVYKLDDKGERKLILENQSFSEFEYYFIPENKDDNFIKLFAVFKLDGFEVEIPAFAPIIVTD